VLAALAAVFLAASLVLEAAVPGGDAAGRWLAAAGLVFLVAAVLAPYRPPPPEVPVSEQPHFGITRAGLHVHLRTRDHLPHGNVITRINAKIAVAVTVAVGSMYCAYCFAGLAIAGLPTALKPGNIGLLYWISGDLLQLTLLSVIIVGQNIQARASDARSAKTFEDAEESKADLKVALDRLDETTEGGLKAILDAVTALAAQPPQAAAVNVSIPDAQVEELAQRIQVKLLAPAKKNPGPGGAGRGF